MRDEFQPSDDDAVETPDEEQASRGSPLRLIAIAAVGGVAAVAAGLAALAPQIAGVAGLVFLVGLAAATMLMMLALMGRRRVFGARAAQDGASAQKASAALFEALVEPAVIIDRYGAPRRANQAYRSFAERAGAPWTSGRPPGLDRVLGAHSSGSAAVYRLARAAQRGEALREITARGPFGRNGELCAFELETAPLPGEESLWRLREIAPADEMEAAANAPVSDVFLEEAPVGFFSASAEGRVTYINRTLREWLGVTDEDEEPLKLKDFLPDPSRVLGRGRRPGGGPIRADVQLKCRDGIVSDATVLTTWTDGGERPVSRSLVFDRTNFGAPAGVAPALAPEGSGAALAGGMMDAMFAHAPFGVARLDGVDPAAALIRDANPALLEMTAGQSAPGTRISELFDLTDPEMRAAFENTQTGAENAIELMLREDPPAKRGEERFARLIFAPEPGGRATAYVLEITAEREYRRQLLHSQKMDAVGQLAAEIAHNFNNILLAVELNTGTMMSRHPIGDPDYQLLCEIAEGVQEGSALANALLAFARKQTFQPQVLELSEAVSSYFVTVRTLVGGQVKAHLEHGRDLPFIKVDRVQLMQAVVNLANNARDAMAPKGGELTIRTDVSSADEMRELGLVDVEDGDYAVIQVSDTGCGMDEETSARIFEPFFTTKDVGKGTGLGLSTVFGIIKQSGGHIRVDSILGEGTTFTLYIPAHAATAEEREEARKRVHVAERKPQDLSGYGRVLLVDDNDLARRASLLTLKNCGYEVVEAEDGEEALEILQERASSFDLILSDVSMPGMGGPELIRAARHLIGDMPVVLMSGLAREDLAETLAAEPNVRFMSKPFKVEELAAMMKQEMHA